MDSQGYRRFREKLRIGLRCGSPKKIGTFVSPWRHVPQEAELSSRPCVQLPPSVGSSPESSWSQYQAPRFLGAIERFRNYSSPLHCAEPERSEERRVGKE